MSSKLVKGGSRDAQQILWRAAGSALPAEPLTFPPPPGTPTGATPPESPELTELRRQLQTLQQQTEARVHEAYQRGVQQTETNLRQQLTAQTDAAVERLARAVEEISGLRRRCRCAAEQDVVQLALAIARRIIHRELTIDPGTILGLVKAALAHVDQQEVHRVRVHPALADVLRRQLDAIGLPQRCEIVPEAGLERGAAILDTNHGTLDVSVETQFEEIERGFADLVKHPS